MSVEAPTIDLIRGSDERVHRVVQVRSQKTTKSGTYTGYMAACGLTESVMRCGFDAPGWYVLKMMRGPTACAECAAMVVAGPQEG